LHFKLKKSSVAGTDIRNTDHWRQLLEQVIPMLFGMFIKHGLNPSLAEELVQNTVFDAIRGLGSYDPARGNYQQWIMGIGRNNLALEMRQRKKRPVFNGDIAGYLESIDTNLLPDEVLEKKETARIVRKAMDELESKERRVLRAKYIEDLSARMIAQRLGVTEKAVHSLLYRARNSLREKLKTFGPFYNKGQGS
jgi:RNA polymerase sigma-70 factor (ECF subfamily)